MIYKVIGIMSGSSLDGLDIAYVQLQETGGKWGYEIVNATCYEYSSEWKQKLNNAVHLTALDYQLLDCDYGNYIGQQVNSFIESNGLEHKVDLVASHGHTTFHLPQQKMTAQLGNGAAIAAVTQLPVVSDLRAMDIAFGGQGAPIVPIGEKLLFDEYSCFLNIGGIANVSIKSPTAGKEYIAFDVCAANRVLNMLTEELQLSFDEDGKIAATGKLDETLLQQLNGLAYYDQPYPKSLNNDFGTSIIYPLIKGTGIGTADALRTYIEHICQQIKKAVNRQELPVANCQLLVTGGGALNTFLIERLKTVLFDRGITVVVPDINLVQYKEALIMALIGALRWREDVNILASVTGADRDSVGGALWLGRS